MAFAEIENIPPISKELFMMMRACVNKGDVILEFGSGPGSTVELRPFYDLFSIENDPGYMTFNDPDHYFLAKLDGPQQWYHWDIVKKALQLPYKAILFDGPASDGRLIPVIEHIELFNGNVHWFFDDWNIEPIRKDIKKLQEITGRELLVFEVGAKKFAVLLGEGK